MRLPLRLAALLLLAPAAAAAQTAPAKRAAAVEVRVTDARSGQPVSAVEVVLDGRTRAVTDAEGRARVELPRPGAHALTMKRIGYRAESLAVRVGTAPLGLDVQLEPAPLALAPVAIEAAPVERSLARAGFYERRRARGGASFLDRAEIERRRPARVTDLLRGIPGVRIVRWDAGRPRASEIGGPPEVIVTTRYTTRVGDPRLRQCPLLVFLDGVEIQAGEVNAVRPAELAGVEVYSGAADLPPEYNATGAACGILLLWTRAGS